MHLNFTKQDLQACHASSHRQPRENPSFLFHQGSWPDCFCTACAGPRGCLESSHRQPREEISFLFCQGWWTDCSWKVCAGPTSLPRTALQAARTAPTTKAAGAMPGRKPKRKASASVLAPPEQLLQRWGCARAASREAVVACMQAEADALQAAARVAARSAPALKTWLEAVPAEEVQLLVMYSQTGLPWSCFGLGCNRKKPGGVPLSQPSCACMSLKMHGGELSTVVQT